MQQPIASEIKVLSVIHLALFIGQILFAVISLFIIYGEGFIANPSWQTDSNLFILLLVAFAITGYFGGNLIFRKKLAQIIASTKSIHEKFNDYRAACITRWALMEFPVLFSIILFFVINNPIIIAVASAFIISFLTLKPSLRKVASDIGISEIEIKQIILKSS